MPSPPAAYQVSGPHIVHDCLDGEAVILNMTTGVYYSLMGVAAEVWESIGHQHPVHGIVEQAAARYDGDADAMRKSIQEFVDRLVEEKLVVPAAGNAVAPVVPSPGPRPAFDPPRLLRYDDMEALLLLDPVHDAGPGGWPAVKSRP